MGDFRVIRIFEDRQTQLSLNQQEVKDLIQIRNIIGENNLSLQADGKLLIRHYVGFVQVNKTRVLIYPKIALHTKEDAYYNQSFNILVKMLSYSGFAEVKRIPSPQELSRYDGDLLELFIGIFVDELLGLFKRDINRGYRNTLENQSFIKGKIDFTENVKKNSFRQHLHAVRYEEFTEDIILNRILKTVISRLVKRTKVRENRVKLSQALLWLEDVDAVKITQDIWDQVKFTRLNHQYKPVFNMAKLFYYNSSLCLNKGDELTFSFLVPLNKLFERYLYELLKAATPAEVHVRYQGPVKFLGCSGDKGVFQLNPDISLLNSGKVILIVDAKYKEILDAEGRLYVSPADAYQMLAYSVGYGCNDIVIAYPKMLNGPDCFELGRVEIPKNDDKLSLRIIQVDLQEQPEIMVGRLSKYLGMITDQNFILSHCVTASKEKVL